MRTKVLNTALIVVYVSVIFYGLWFQTMKPGIDKARTHVVKDGGVR